MEIPVIIERVKSFNGGFSLISCNLNPYSERYSSQLEQKVSPYINKKYDSLTITANLIDVPDPENMEGGQFIFIGDFVKHPKYGNQFKSDFFYDDVPVTEDGLKQFLMTLPNIKEMRSQAIVQKFGVEGTFDVLDNNVYLLTEIKGITAERIPAIQKAWEEIRCLKDLYHFFVSKNMPPELAKEAYRKWNKNALKIIQNNPYKLTDLRRVGFLTADKFAHKILSNVPIEFRLLSSIQYIMNEFTYSKSNLCIPYTLLKKNVVALVQKCDNLLESELSIKKKSNHQEYLKKIPTCLKENLNLFTIVNDKKTNINYVYLKAIWEKEKSIACTLSERYGNNNDDKIQCTNVDLINAEKNISEFMNLKIVLDECQKEAIQTVFDNKVSIITGAGGTGKSMICRCIFDLAQQKSLSIRIMSPTGKAAQVLTSKTGANASTIHRGLRMKPGDDIPKEPIMENILLIDEISMCGIDTLYAISEALNENVWAHIVFIGDKNQLPSVAPGNFLSDIIESGYANVVTLEKIHRQSENSYISLLANQISEGKVISIPDDATDIQWHGLSSRDFCEDIECFIDEYIKDGNSINDLQFISPMKKGEYGVYKVNEIIQEKLADLNGTKDNFFSMKFGKIHIGDRIIHIENNYEKMIFNGDMGTVIEFGEKVVDPHKSDQKERYITVLFYGEKVSFYGDEIDALQLSWCITVHKFQGSQAPHIVLIMAREAQIMMSKELIYTAFTRAEKTLDIFGDADMLRLAPTKSIAKKRYTNFQKVIEHIKNNGNTLKVLSEKKIES